MYKKLKLICVLWVVAAGVIPVQAGLQDGLVAYFKLDEGSGTVAADASGNGKRWHADRATIGVGAWI